MWERVLEKRTGEGVAVWLKRIERARVRDEGALRAWLGERGVTGYAQSLLVMERFGYPDFLRADWAYWATSPSRIANGARTPRSPRSQRP